MSKKKNKITNIELFNNDLEQKNDDLEKGNNELMFKNNDLILELKTLKVMLDNKNQEIDDLKCHIDDLNYALNNQEYNSNEELNDCKSDLSTLKAEFTIERRKLNERIIDLVQQRKILFRIKNFFYFENNEINEILIYDLDEILNNSIQRTKIITQIYMLMEGLEK